MMDEAAVDNFPVMGPGHLIRDIVKGLDAHVVGIHLEDPAGLRGRHSAELGDDEFNHEVATWREMGRSVYKHPQLLLLGREVHDGVGHHVDQLETAREAFFGHIADHHGDRLSALLSLKLLDHVRRELNAIHRYTACAKGEGDAPGTNGEFEYGAATGELHQEVHHRVDNRWN